MAEKTNITKENFVDVEAVSLSRIILDLDRPVRLPKMDIEGAEVELAPHLIETGAAERVRMMLVETQETIAPVLPEATQVMRYQAIGAGFAARIKFD